MKIFKQIFDFYINSSIHVALSVYALSRITQYMFHIYDDEAIIYFAFFGTIMGYNFVKYDALARVQKKQMRNELKAIVFLSFLSLIAVGFCFFQLQIHTQIVAVAFLGLTLLYTLPFFPNRKNARNWAGVKIYMVALSWVGVTLILPILNAEIIIGSDFYLKCIQRFILVFVLILIFEIIDLQYDDPHLKTVPQQIGVKRTKYLGYILLLIYCGLEIFNINGNDNLNNHFFSLPLQSIIAVIIAIFIFFANENRPKYYTSFWVESIPIILGFLLLIFG
ncbi:MAG: hypothetical protein ABI549_04625 [Flavobacterium sp.]|uniref:hypothetical protein n=1 Tax=Flavobacterium sp. TaxID=239 RepID=UPI003264D539